MNGLRSTGSRGSGTGGWGSGGPRRSRVPPRRGLGGGGVPRSGRFRHTQSQTDLKSLQSKDSYLYNLSNIYCVRGTLTALCGRRTLTRDSGTLQGTQTLGPFDPGPLAVRQSGTTTEAVPVADATSFVGARGSSEVLSVLGVEKGWSPEVDPSCPVASR